jgi:ActR/RegA family two-component response regulator
MVANGEKHMDNSKRTVLIIDDQHNWRKLLVELLVDEFVVEEAGTYEDAIRKIREHTNPFHVVVSDIRLVDGQPENEEGMQLVDELCRNAVYTNAVVITGYPTVRTAKRAFRTLNAFDYLEKHPANGQPFNPTEFRRTIRQAANDAERRRPDALVLPSNQILLIESNAASRKKLLDVLNRDGYEVVECSVLENVSKNLPSDDRAYNLIVANEKIIDLCTDFFQIVQTYQPEARVIFLTDEKKGGLVSKIQEQTVFGVVPIQDQFFDSWLFQETVRQAFAPEAIKYVLATLEKLDKGTPLKVGEVYKLRLTLQDNRESGATGIRLVPGSAKKGRILLKIFVHAPHMKLLTETEVFWGISPSEHPKPLIVELIPQVAQKTVIVIDIEQERRWLGRIEKEIEVK